MRIRFAVQRVLLAGLLLAAVVPASVAAATDSDGDGLPNTFERYRSRTSPTSKLLTWPVSSTTSAPYREYTVMPGGIARTS